MASTTTESRSIPTISHPSRTVSVQTSVMKDGKIISNSSTSTSSKPSMKGRIDLSNLTQNNIGQLRKLNSVLFPVRFGEKWYKDVLKKDSKEVCKFGLFNDIPVANVCCRFEKSSTSSSQEEGLVKVYIMTLGCLAPYRRMGISSVLLNHILEIAGPGKEVELFDSFEEVGSTNVTVSAKPAQTKSNTKDAKSTTTKQEEEKGQKYKVESVYLHVQTSNEEAKQFYEKHGFSENERIEDYYKTGIEPRSAWLLERR